MRVREKSARLSAAIAVGIGLIALGGTPADACDVCAVYTGTELRENRVGPWIGVAEQFSRFTTLQQGGEEISNPAHERMESSITQLLIGYTPAPRWQVQLNLPVVVRSFRRVGEAGIDRGRESGLGDLSLFAHYNAWSHVSETSVARFTLFAGVEAPSGDSDRLAEELDEGHHDEEETGDEGVGAESGIHGHDLALGSGSWEGVFGARLFASWQRAFFSGSVQYGLRTEGDFDYAYADEIAWSGGPGVFLIVGHDHLFGLQGSLSGETKGKDTLRGERKDDTALTALYAGPGLVLTWGSALAADVAADLPVLQNNTALQIVADFRIRGGITWRF